MIGKRNTLALVVVVVVVAMTTTMTTSIMAFTTTSVPSKTKPSSSSATTKITTKTHLSMGLFDNIGLFKQVSKTTLTTSKQQRRPPKVVVPNDFVIPEPKPLTLTRPETLPDVLKRSIPLGLRLASSVFVLGWKIETFFAPDDGNYALQIGPFRIRDTSTVLANAPRPIKPIIVYEYDASPYCQRVREIVNVLDLTVEYRPCPGARQSKFSDDLLQRTGKQTVPYMIDENTGTEMFESSDIIDYLVNTYGPPAGTYDKKALWPITFESFSIYTSTLSSIIMGMPGSKRQANARIDNELMLPIELWAYEASPFCRPVRAKLCSLALPHKYISCSRGSVNRSEMIKRTGGKQFQVPYIYDPNTGLELFESNEICEYLDLVYTTKTTTTTAN